MEYVRGETLAEKIKRRAPMTLAQNPGAVLSATTGSIYAGQPRTVYAGVKSRF